jgi:hypothetical protein
MKTTKPLPRLLNSTGTGTGGAVTGTGTISGAGTPLAITVTGTHSHPNVSLNANAPGFEPMNFQGTFTNDNTINGTLNGSGFDNFALTLQRQ